MGDAGEGIRDYADTFSFLDPFMSSSDERSEEEYRAQSMQAIEGLGAYMPSQADLMGLTSSMGGGMTDDWYNQWLQSSGYGPQTRTGAPPSTTTRYAPGTRTTAGGGVSVDPYSGGYRSSAVSGSGTQNKGNIGGGQPFGMSDEDWEAYQARRAQAEREGREGADGTGGTGDITVNTSHYGMDRDGNYIPGSAGGSAPSMSGRRAPEGDLRQMAAQAWMQEQMRKDPYFGLSQLGTPEMAGAAADPQSIEAQRRALQQMQGIADAGGWTQEEKSQNRMAQQDASRYEQSQRAAAQQQAAMRGMNQSGAAMMGALSAQQGGANRAADSADRFAIEGQRRALQAMQQAGNWGGQMRSQSFGEDAQRRQARDAWTQANVGAQNDWTRYRGQMAQQAYGNRENQTALLSGQYGDQADWYGERSEDTGEDRRETVNTAASAYTGGGMGGGG
jgi:hypothetical protein